MSDRALIAATLSLMAAAVHAGLAPDHWAASAPLGVSFVLAAIGQTWCAAAFTRGPNRRVTQVTVALNVAILVCYIASRTVGLPYGEGGWWVPEPFGVLDVLTALAEGGILLMLIPRTWRWMEPAGIASGAALFCLLVSGMAAHG